MCSSDLNRKRLGHLVGPDHGIGLAAGDVIAEQLRAIDLNTITPLEAMRLLFELQQKARG